jgi:hypothetical protein
MKLITITGSRDALDDLFAQLRQDFEHDQIPAIEVDPKDVPLRRAADKLCIEFLEVPETVYALEFEEREA